MRQSMAMMIRNSFAMAIVAAGLVMSVSAANAQGYFVDGRAASTAEVRYLISQGMPPGNWRIDGWGIGPAAVAASKAAVPVAENSDKCWYVLDVLLGDCGDAGRAVAERAPDATASPKLSAHVERAAADTREEVNHSSSIRHATGTDRVFGADR